MSEVPYVYERFNTQAWPTRSVRVSNHCDGSPTCAVEILIEENSGKFYTQEVHLTQAEAERLIDLIRTAITPAPAAARRRRRFRIRWWR